MTSKKEGELNKTRISAEPSLYDNPVDHGWAWMVLLGCFGISMFILGGLKSFGVLYVELAKKFQVSNQALSGIQSLAGFFFLFLAPLSNALSTRFTHRVVIFTGGIITSCGLILSSQAPSVTVLYFTYGLITGIGYSLCFSSMLVMVANYFAKYRSFATGFALSGGGLGSMTFPYLIRYFINQYGLEGAMMIYAGMMSNICVFAMLLRPFTNYPLRKTHDICNQEGNIKELDSLIPRGESADNGKSSSIENTTVSPHHPNSGQVNSSKLHPDDQTESDLHLSKESVNVVAKKNNFLHEINWKLFLSPVFIVFFAVIFFAMISYHSLFNIVPPYADELGLSGEDGALILLVFGAADLIGRIAFGVLMDIFPNPKHRHIIFTACVAVSTVGVIMTSFFQSLLSISLFMASYGCFAGGFNGTGMIVLVDKVGMKVLPSAWGFICLSASIAMLINPWASGLIKDGTGTWANAFRFTGSMSVVAVILLLILPCIERRYNRRNTARV
ncbi:monocarboxylate transporter 12-like [Ylistrum balloti]|uniref:monocarboxylate transporter 12-like n=1 Tax=Ylistrum balloti TaxID=509963 RepID=UPI002905AD8D|nr:monocarboxylate transporter 12-like [Ylistrum balloti]